MALDLNNSFAVANQYGHLPGSDQLFSIKNASWSGIVVTDPVIGSVHGIARDSAGAPLKKYDLNAWGRIASPDTGVVTRFRMAGREYDPESGLYYMRARYYDPEVGRFLSEDPVGIEGGLNLYEYAANDPVNRLDPTGTDVVCTQWWEAMFQGDVQLTPWHKTDKMCYGTIGLPASQEGIPGTELPRTGKANGATQSSTGEPSCRAQGIQVFVSFGSDVLTVALLMNPVTLVARGLVQFGAGVVLEGGAVLAEKAVIRTAPEIVVGLSGRRMALQGAALTIGASVTERTAQAGLTSWILQKQLTPARKAVEAFVPGVRTARLWQEYQECKSGGK